MAAAGCRDNQEDVSWVSMATVAANGSLPRWRWAAAGLAAPLLPSRGAGGDGARNGAIGSRKRSNADTGAAGSATGCDESVIKPAGENTHVAASRRRTGTVAVEPPAATKVQDTSTCAPGMRVRLARTVRPAWVSTATHSPECTHVHIH